MKPTKSDTLVGTYPRKKEKEIPIGSLVRAIRSRKFSFGWIIDFGIVVEKDKYDLNSYRVLWIREKEYSVEEGKYLYLVNNEQKKD